MRVSGGAGKDQMRRRVLLAVAACLALWTPAQADDGNAADFVRAVGHEMPNVLHNAHTIEEKREALQPFIARVVDVPAVARFCLGRYWATATPQQQQDYQQLFFSVLINTIATWSGNYGQTRTPTAVEMGAPFVQEDETFVPTTVQSGELPAAHITWVVNMNARPPRIRDVVAEGISLRATQRSDYLSYLRHHDGDIAAFIAVLRSRSHDIGGNPFTSVGAARPPLSGPAAR